MNNPDARLLGFIRKIAYGSIDIWAQEAARALLSLDAYSQEGRCETCGSTDPGHRKGVVRDGMDLCDDDGFHDTPRGDARGASST